MTIKEFIISALSEPGTQNISWGRCASTVALLAAISWVTHFVLHWHALPDLTGPTAFTLGPYAANKSMTALQNVGQAIVGRQ